MNQHPKDIVELAQWLMDGVLECLINGNWQSFNQAKQFILNIYWDNSFSIVDYNHRTLGPCGPKHYRRKPSPKLRPWRPEEVPVGCIVKPKHLDFSANKYVLVAINGSSVSFGRAGYQSIESMLEDYMCSTDNGKTWHPCGVEE